MSKKNVSSALRTFSADFCAAVQRVLDAKCKNGDAVTRVEIAKALRKEVVIKNQTMLATLVSLAVKEGSLPEYAAVRGKNGGIYNIAQRDAWNASVDAPVDAPAAQA